LRRVRKVSDDATDLRGDIDPFDPTILKLAQSKNAMLLW
jgi:hypothetical protein